MNPFLSNHAILWCYPGADPARKGAGRRKMSGFQTSLSTPTLRDKSATFGVLKPPIEGQPLSSFVANRNQDVVVLQEDEFGSVFGRPPFGRLFDFIAGSCPLTRHQVKTGK
jgi:hypothetical protein